MPWVISDLDYLVLKKMGVVSEFDPVVRVQKVDQIEIDGVIYTDMWEEATSERQKETDRDEDSADNV